MVSYVYENTPDMVFVTESCANENTMDSELALNGCVTRRKDRKDRRGGGGLIYATEEVSAQCDIDLSDCNEEILRCRLAESNILAGVCYNSTSNMLQLTEGNILAGVCYNSTSNMLQLTECNILAGVCYNSTSNMLQLTEGNILAGVCYNSTSNMLQLTEGNILAGVCYNSTSNTQEEEAIIHSNIIQVCSRMSIKEVMLCGYFNHNTIN